MRLKGLYSQDLFITEVQLLFYFTVEDHVIEWGNWHGCCSNVRVLRLCSLKTKLLLSAKNKTFFVAFHKTVSLFISFI
jgi:hypothetical protein